MDKVKYKPGKKIIQVKPQEMDVDLTILNKILKESIDKKAWPGCVLVAAKSGKIFIKKAEGYHTYHKKRKMREKVTYLILHQLLSQLQRYLPQ